MSDRPAAHLNGTAASLPGPPLAQTELTPWLSRRLAPGSNARRFGRFLEASGVAFRHSVLDFHGGEADAYYPADGSPIDTAQRMRTYAERSLPLATEAAARLLAGRADGITHLIVASCTGFCAPGLETRLIDTLGLSPGVSRIQIGFMGCYAGITALRQARDQVLADPAARVLVVCCELGSLHLRLGPEDDALLAACLFADGAGAALVSAEPQGPRLGTAASGLVPDPDGAAMAWRIGNQGFDIRLSRSVTRALGGELAGFCGGLVAGGRRPDRLHWLVHPGGPAILRAVATAMKLDVDHDLAPSWQALAAGGNRSSVTILAMLAQQEQDAAVPSAGTGVLLAFGPGLTMEGLLLEYGD